MALNHSTLVDGKKHTPKNFGSASVGQSSWKNQSGDNEYFATGKLPDCINVVDALTAPPTEVTGDVYVLTDTSLKLGRQQISAINWQSGTTVRATFDTGYDLTTPAVGDYIYVQNSGQSLQNGRFVITAEGVGTIDYTNANITSAAADEASSPAYASFGLSNWDGGTSGDWVKFNGTIWESILMGNGSSVYNIDNDVLYFYRKSLLVVDTQYKINRLTATQTSTSAPSTTRIGINEVGSISWAYTSVGTYTGTLSEAFTLNKTHFIVSNIGLGYSAEITRTDASIIVLKTYDATNVLKDGIITDIGITITVAY